MDRKRAGYICSSINVSILKAADAEIQTIVEKLSIAITNNEVGP